ncbi:MAG TPA: hypothetical protein DCS93_23610 [Microscillaceae bacterium]|nr:hypothetical protein [Microscillaceae bacterium]
MNTENLSKALALIKKATTSLSLKELWLEELPEELASLTSLKKLDLNHNNLETLPDWIGQLTRLENLNLWGNKLKTLSESIGQLQQLKVLQMDGNKLAKLPQSIGQLAHLEELILESNALTALPENIDQLTQLKVLDLGRNPIEQLPDNIGQLPNLERLNLTYTKLKALPTSIGQLTKLTSLSLFGVDLETLPDEVQALTHLETLFISDCQNFKKLPDDLSNMTGLRDLMLKNCNLEEIPKEVFTLPNLQFLRLENNHLTHIPEKLMQMKHLKGLFLGNNKINVLPAFLSAKEWLTIDLSSNPIALTSFPENFGDFQLANFSVYDTPFAQLKLNADFSMPSELTIKGLVHKISKKGFAKEINQMKTELSQDALQEIQQRYLTKLNKSLVKWNGSDGKVTKVSEFQAVFLQVLFDKKLAKIKKAAKTHLEIYYESSPRKISIDIDKISLPTDHASAWEITLNNRDFMGPVVVISLNGWSIEEETLVG